MSASADERPWGMAEGTLLTEIREQPAALARLLEREEEIAASSRLAPRRPPVIRFVARLFGQCRHVRRLRLRPPARLDSGA